MVSFPQASPPEPCAHLSHPPYAPHAPPISFFSILPPVQYWVRSTDHYVHYVIFSIPLLPRLSQAQTLTSTPYSQTPSAYVPPSTSATKFHTHTGQRAKL
jgi:hypothetical protein